MSSLGIDKMISDEIDNAIFEGPDNEPRTEPLTEEEIAAIELFCNDENAVVITDSLKARGYRSEMHGETEFWNDGNHAWQTASGAYSMQQYEDCLNLLASHHILQERLGWLMSWLTQTAEGKGTYEGFDDENNLRELAAMTRDSLLKKGIAFSAHLAIKEYKEHFNG